MDKYSYMCPPGRCIRHLYMLHSCVSGVLWVCPGACVVSDVTLCGFQH